MSCMTIKLLKDLISDMPDDALVMYHSYDKGCCLSSYSTERAWKYPRNRMLNEGELPALVMNPDEDYDGRQPQKKGQKQQ